LRRLIWSATAQQDLRAINRFYGELDPDLPLRFVERVELAASKLIDHPQLGPALPDSDKRVWRARGTPFLLLYRPTRDGVRILAVRDARSDWKPRS
jgi:plasmid stabilization system protein ParE